MGRALAGLFAQIIIATAVFAINMFFVSIAGLLRLLPALVPVIGRALWALLIVSCRLYYLVITRVAPFIKRRTRINIVEGLWRAATTVFLSLLLGVIILLAARFPLTFWTITPLILHGLIVDFVWDDIPEAGGLQMGTRL